MHKIGRYQVEMELGRGAMGIVYRAFDPAIGRRIAIKTIRLDEIGDDKSRKTLRERLLREAQSAGILSHPNIVTIYDVSEDAGNAYIFMEYVEGTTLEHVPRGLEVADLLSVLEQTAEALDYAHSRGIVHRDIKPGNLMLSGQQVKVTDFGIARLQHRDSTQTGTLLGTPSYMSPEQVAGGEITGAADQYSLGVIAYEFLAGVKPFENDNLANLLYRITQMPVPPVARLNAATNQVLARVLAKNPEHRYPNCAEFVRALEHALGLQPSKFVAQRESLGDEPTLVSTEALVAPPAVSLPPLQLPPPPKPSFWKPVMGTVFGAGLLMFVIWFSFGRSRVEPPAAPTPPSVTQNVTEEEKKPSPMGEKVNVPPPAPVVEPSTEPESAPEKIEPKPAETLRQPELTAPAMHAFQFLSVPAGAEVLVNGGEQDRCPKTPCVLNLPEGEFSVTFRMPDFEDASRTIRVPSQERLSVEFEKPQGTIVVNSNPPGATVRINGVDSGQKTPAMLKLPPGKYTLEILKDNLPSQSKVVTVRNGVIQTLAIQWN